VRLLLKNLLFTFLIPGTVAVYVPVFVLAPTAADGLWTGLSSVLLTTGAATYAWCVWDFASFGRGTPLPLDAPRKLVVRGLYRYTRNPMYVGVLTFIVGWAVRYRSASLFAYAAVVAIAFELFVILYEEPHLRLVFGHEYDAYCAAVNRWLPGPV